MVLSLTLGSSSVESRLLVCAKEGVSHCEITGLKLSETPSLVRKTISPVSRVVNEKVRLRKSGLLPTQGPKDPPGQRMSLLSISQCEPKVTSWTPLSLL